MTVLDHIKAMTELFALSVVGDPGRLCGSILASLPELYNMLVTALGVNAEVPK